jgi:hypothetical protein
MWRATCKNSTRTGLLVSECQAAANSNSGVGSIKCLRIRLKSQMQLLADRYPLIDTSLMQAENRLERPGAIFYNLERMDRWREAGSFDNILRVNREALAFLRERFEQSGAPRESAAR